MKKKYEGRRIYDLSTNQLRNVSFKNMKIEGNVSFKNMKVEGNVKRVFQKN